MARSIQALEATVGRAASLLSIFDVVQSRGVVRGDSPLAEPPLCSSSSMPCRAEVAEASYEAALPPICSCEPLVACAVLFPVCRPFPGAPSKQSTDAAAIPPAHPGRQPYISTQAELLVVVAAAEQGGEELQMRHASSSRWPGLRTCLGVQCRPPLHLFFLVLLCHLPHLSSLAGVSPSSSSSPLPLCTCLLD